MIQTACTADRADSAETIPAVSAGESRARMGAEIAVRAGCAACHGADFRGGIGPAWIGLAGSTVTLADGRNVTADEPYLRRAIVEPSTEVVAGYVVQMPTLELTDAEVDALVAYILSLGASSG